METNPLKMKPYYLSTFTKSLKTPSCKTMPQWSFKKTMSKWTSMPGCTIPLSHNDFVCNVYTHTSSTIATNIRGIHPVSVNGALGRDRMAYP